MCGVCHWRSRRPARYHKYYPTVYYRYAMRCAMMLGTGCTAWSTHEPGEQAVAGLSLTFWPNPVYRNHPAEKRWYFSVAMRETAAQPVQVVRYRGEWYDMAGHLLDTKEETLAIHLAPLQHI